MRRRWPDDSAPSRAIVAPALHPLLSFGVGAGTALGTAAGVWRQRAPPWRGLPRSMRRGGPVGGRSSLLLIVRLSTERERQAPRQDCSFPGSRSLRLRSWSSSRAGASDTTDETLASTSKRGATRCIGETCRHPRGGRGGRDRRRSTAAVSVSATPLRAAVGVHRCPPPPAEQHRESLRTP